MSSLVLFLCLLVCGISPVEKMSPQCVSYAPANVALKGEISRQTFAGRPNFESVKQGDEPETYWVLHLTAPTCLVASETMPDGDAESNVSDLQLGLDEQQYARYQDLLGKQVVVSGTLSHAISGHHHTKVLLKVAEIKLSDHD